MILLKGIVGSNAYGQATESSDLDFMTVVVDGLENYFGLESNDKFHSKQTTSILTDETVYEFLQFMKLCYNFNPNIIPLLFLEKEGYIIRSPFIEPIIQNNNLFLSHIARNTLRGYAISQDNKSRSGVTGDKGEKRKALIKKYGYDVKAASHTLRLLYMGIYLFDNGSINLKYQSDLCLNVKIGKYSKNEYNEMVKDLFNEFEKTASKNQAGIPEKPDYSRISKICVEVMSSIFCQEICKC